MATEQHGSTSDFDMSQHLQTWNAFCRLMLWGVISVAIVLALMAYFLT